MQTSTIERENSNARSGQFSQRIGSTVYQVAIYFPDKETESLEDKILRLVKNDLIYGVYEPERGNNGFIESYEPYEPSESEQESEMAKNDLIYEPKRGNITVLQTSRLPNGGSL